LHCDQHIVRLALPGADRQLARVPLDRAHRFHGIQDQIQDDLLQLNTIAVNEQRPLQSGPDQNPILCDCALHHLDNLIDRLVEVERLASWRCLLDVLAHAINDAFGPVGIPDNAGERLFDFGQIWRAHFQKAHSCTRIVAGRGDGVQDFVSQRGGQFSHYAHAIHVREI
jgi:hypothetical protein